MNFKSNSGFSASIINKGNNRVSVVVNCIAAANIHMNLVDMNGKMILQERFPVFNGGTVKDLYLNRGIYILVLSDPGSDERISKKIIVY
ncbi:MAG: T9SS type A sorting domain-containing protein [Chitinophagaceae bacterium]|nr:T9SS type A sorting domain-containing protein [Chitinophagaceae bacterium]